jgi:hypothetical protein
VSSETNGIRHRLSGFSQHFKATLLFVCCKKISFPLIFCHGRRACLKLLRSVDAPFQKRYKYEKARMSTAKGSGGRLHYSYSDPIQMLRKRSGRFPAGVLSGQSFWCKRLEVWKQDVRGREAAGSSEGPALYRPPVRQNGCRTMILPAVVVRCRKLLRWVSACHQVRCRG